MRTPKLKRINLKKCFRGGGIGSCDHPDIRRGATYLVKIYGELYAGTFSKQWYGWSFDNWGTSGIQLDSGGFSDVWQIMR